MGGIFTILVIVGCVALILFILVQNPKGGGLNSEFGSAAQLGGAKRATDILEKGTWGLAIGVALLCLFMATGGSGASAGDGDGVEIDASTDFTTEEPGGIGDPGANPGLQPFDNPGVNPNQ